MVGLTKKSPRHRVVIIGGGFGGLYAAKALSKAKVDVTLIDKRNFHLFQPLLYQVATGVLSPSDISSPLRSVLSSCRNTKVLLGEVNDIDAQKQKVFMGDEAIPYDTLIVATGARHSYFGKDDWEKVAPGLKTLEDAIGMRRRIYSAFEAAEKETDAEKRQALLTFVIVGAGPTGVELAGAIGELSNQTLKGEFRHINTSEARILLLQGGDRILPTFAPELSEVAKTSLNKLGVIVETKTKVTDIGDGVVTVKQGDKTMEIHANTILWAAGVQASPMSQVLTERTGAQCDRTGRIIVEPDLTIPGYDNIFVIGDLAHFAHQTGQPLPGVAPVAKQQGEYVASLIARRLNPYILSQFLPKFKYTDMGSLAMIGQNAAVVEFGFIKMSGFFAWVFWLLIHIYFLIEFENKIIVMLQWAWNYMTGNRGARIITGQDYTLSSTTDSDKSHQSTPDKQSIKA